MTLFIVSASSTPMLAVEDPRLNSINKVGINLLSPDSEIEEASQMINNNGDWGWALIIIKKSERNVDRWQSVFHKLSKAHIIPIVRIATDFDSRGFWQKPTDEDAHTWADFFSKLYWPTKNRYVQIYNEVNHANEWGGNVDPVDYAKELSKTADELKAKSDEFFILNAPLDLAVETSVTSLDAGVFYQTMGDTVPDVFGKLDGWASHSYPNPGFLANPQKQGRESIKGYEWELSLISNYRDNSDLPVFITETGWRRQTAGKGGLPEQTVADYYKHAFENIWNDDRVVAITPFVFHYPDGLFDGFSFKTNGDKLKEEFYAYYFTIRDLIKGRGDPNRSNLADKFEVDLPTIIITNFSDRGKLKIKNVGNEIWKVGENLKLEIEATNAKFSDLSVEKQEILPGEDLNASFKLKSDKSGEVDIKIRTISEDQILASSETTLKSEPWIFRIFDILRSFSN